MSTRISKADKEVLKALLEKHQKKHAGCKLNERRCRAKLSDDCIVKGDKSRFHATAYTCKECLVIVNRKYYEKVTALKRKKAKRSVTFKKGTKKE